MPVLDDAMYRTDLHGGADRLLIGLACAEQIMDDRGFIGRKSVSIRHFEAALLDRLLRVEARCAVRVWHS